MSKRPLIVNAVTFSRLPIIFAWLGFALYEEYAGGFWPGFFAGTALFLSGITDLADGLLARRWNVVTPLGKMADPLMDKAVYVVVFPSLTWLVMHQPGGEWHSLVLLGFTILYTLRDLWVTFMRSVASLYGGDGAAMWLGKVRTALTFPTAGLIYAYVVFNAISPCWLERTLLVLCYISEAAMIGLNAFSFYSYTKAYAPYLKKALERKREI